MIPERLDDLTPTARAQIGEQVLDLVALALAAERGEDRPALSSARAIALLRLRTAVERRLSDPGLDPATAAASAGISVRYANALLAEEGLSIERLIVSAAPRALPSRACPIARQAHRTIGDIAFAWGFSDLSHFTRRFKSVFGCAPSDYRKTAARAERARSAPCISKNCSNCAAFR